MYENIADKAEIRFKLMELFQLFRIGSKDFTNYNGNKYCLK